jgi:phage shock protein E
MLNAIKSLFGVGAKVDFRELKKQGAIILDVRTKAEFQSGHIQGAMNISVDQLGSNLSKLKDKNQPIITCCRSGMRSASAKSILKSSGYTNVHNGGSWTSLKSQL